MLRHAAAISLSGQHHYADLEALLAALRTEGIAITELALQEADLEQVFLRIMGGERPAAKLPQAATKAAA